MAVLRQRKFEAGLAWADCRGGPLFSYALATRECDLKGCLMLKVRSSIIAAGIFCAPVVTQSAFAQSNAGSNAPATQAVPAMNNSTNHSMKTKSSKMSASRSKMNKKVAAGYKHSQLTNPPGAQPGMGAGMGKASGTQNGN